ncbi:MAG: hypothetical protein LBB87_01885 [Nitrososphaerota archaeon]|jgi:hypothetical protein|nr:hypothetical protein [Nitrososphaerota archaeon]
MKRTVWAILFAVIIVVCILVFAVAMDRMPNGHNRGGNHASEQAALDKSLAIAELMGVDTAKYSVTLDSYRQGLFLDVLPEERVHCIFESDEGNITVSYSYIEGNLQSLTVNTEGQTQTNRPITSNFEMAQDFLNKYQTFSGASYYTKMLSMLKDVEPDKDTTKISGNIELRVTQDKSITEIRWTYIEKDIAVPVKNVALYFEQGFLKYFTDKWDIYKIGSNKITLSEKEAVEIAINHAKDYTWNTRSGGENNQVKVTELNIAGVIETQLNFENRQDNTKNSEDPFTLYPMWRVELKLDKIYPDNVYGLEVTINADTKEVYTIQTMIQFGT